MSKIDHFTRKMDLIHDIMAAKKQLFGFGYKAHADVINKESAGLVFNQLYEMNESQLQAQKEKWETAINTHIQRQINKNINA